jgi:hypothetical protein
MKPRTAGAGIALLSSESKLAFESFCFWIVAYYSLDFPQTAVVGPFRGFQ